MPVGGPALVGSFSPGRGAEGALIPQINQCHRLLTEMNDLKVPSDHKPPPEQPPQGFGESPSLQVFRNWQLPQCFAVLKAFLSSWRSSYLHVNATLKTEIKLFQEIKQLNRSGVKRNSHSFQDLKAKLHNFGKILLGNSGHL